MSKTIVGLCTIEFYLPGLASLKEKRGVLKSLLARMHNTFNVSAAEVDRQDSWQSAIVAVACVGNSSAHAHQVIESVLKWLEKHYPEAMVVSHEVEIL
ncbi:MAG: DUF503 domain-containing protein [Chloroflexi bacterium]|nr:DUF503 domain-containing protein [Chloroflexota bacterium]